MSEITVPDVNDLILTGLSLSAPAQVNRSKWTGKRKVVGLPGIELWRAQISIDIQATEEAERPWRAFLWGLKGPTNWFRHILPCATHAGSKPTVAAGASDGYALPLTGLSVSTAILKAGQFMTVPLPSGAYRVVCLTADLTSDGSGNATAKPKTPSCPSRLSILSRGSAMTAVWREPASTWRKLDEPT